MTDTPPAQPPSVPEPPIPEAITPIANGTTDVEMADSTTDAQPELPPNPFQSPPHVTQEAAPLPTITSASTPAAPSTATPKQEPVATGTPSRNTPQPSGSQQAPAHPNPHGSPTRVYLNQNVTPHLLEAMKHLVTQEPDKPLKWLSEFLAQKSAEIEGA
ncbi:hypothetical protein EJ04DRAFT_510902 [Polyplosphaeria fusca]|uniref:Dpy-30 domain-containing protein n=1 Tax=Polyplosphaeria fusca TaxID=682080 RepID=A0A9P4V1P8_9PLEO|nr:hypothetical protein EJ04DRAFT_510902 [Polyplosphaeria fusca]